MVKISTYLNCFPIMASFLHLDLLFLIYRFRGFEVYGWSIFVVLLVSLVIMQPLTWFQFLWITHRGITEPRNTFLRWIYDMSAKIIESAKLRTAMYLLISMGLAITSILNVVGCSEVKVVDRESVLSNCVSSWVS